MTYAPPPLPRHEHQRELAAFRDWLARETDLIAHYALWLGGIAWAEYAERVCDGAKGPQLRREDVRELYNLFGGRLHGIDRCMGLPLQRLPEDDPRPEDVRTIAASLARGLRVLGAKRPDGSPVYHPAPLSSRERARRARRREGPCLHLGPPAPDGDTAGHKAS